MVFRPTMEEMADFSAYVAFMESVGAANYGVARVIPPPEYQPRKSGYSLDGPLGDFVVPHPIEQNVTGTGGNFMVINVEKPSMSLRDFAALADKRGPPAKARDDLAVSL